MKRSTIFIVTALMLSLVATAVVSDALAQPKERVVFKVDSANTKYTQQYSIDVDDNPGHQVRVFEVRRTYPINPPVINGMKLVDSWARGSSDYTNNRGPSIVYHTYVAENGDKFFAQSATVAVQGTGGNFSGTTVGPITGGTGNFKGIRGLLQLSITANPKTGANETQAEIEYWFDK